MERRETPDKDSGNEFHFTTREEWLGRMEKRTFHAEELPQLLFQIREAEDWHEEKFGFDPEDEELFCISLAELAILGVEVENEIIENQQITDEEVAVFFPQDETYISSLIDKEVEIFRDNLIDNET